MARPNDPNRGGKKHNAADQEQEEVQEVEKKEPERDRRQDQMGNQAVASMVSTGSAGGGAGGGGGQGMAARHADQEKEGVDYGGDDEPDAVDVPFEEQFLAAAIRPRTRKSEQKARFSESMPDDDLPDEDADWMAAVRSLEPPTEEPMTSMASLLQPTREVLASSLADWTRGALDWGPQTIPWYLLARVTLPMAPGLVDPGGRVLLSRARAGAIGLEALLQTIGASVAPEPGVAALCLLDLELRGRERRKAVHASQSIELFEGTLPVARTLYDHCAPPTAQRRRLYPATPEAERVLADSIRAILSMPDPSSLVPSYEVEEHGWDEDDPLNLDAVIREHTQGSDEPVWVSTTIKAAERLAEYLASLRIEGAATAVIIGEVANLWTPGPPHDQLRATMDGVDRSVADTLSLLVDIARAATNQEVGARGLRNGLRRAAKQCTALTEALISALAALLAGAAPPGMTRPPPSLERTELLEAIDAALDTKEADIALPWLAEELTGWERDFACALLCLGCGQLDQGDRFNQLCAAAPASFASICDMIRDAAMLREGRAAEADPTRRAQKARELRNGLGLAEAAISAVEAAWNQEHREQAETLRLYEGRWLYHHGGVPGVSLLARWSPLPEHDWDD